MTKNVKQYIQGDDIALLMTADGAMSTEEYEPIKTQRALWRAEINELERTLSK